MGSKTTSWVEGLFPYHRCIKYREVGFFPGTFDRSNINLRNVKARGYITFFMLNSAEHDTLNACMYKKYQEINHFQAQVSLECYFSRS